MMGTHAIGSYGEAARTQRDAIAKLLITAAMPIVLASRRKMDYRAATFRLLNGPSDRRGAVGKGARGVE